MNMNKPTMQKNNKQTDASSKLKLLRRSSPTPAHYSRENQIDYVQKALKKALIDLRQLQRDVDRQLRAKRQHVSRALTAFTRLVNSSTIVALVLFAVICSSVQAEPRARACRHENRNYILRRQSAYQVQGVPASALIIGKREIDIYRDGSMFEKNNYVGNAKR